MFLVADFEIQSVMISIHFELYSPKSNFDIHKLTWGVRLENSSDESSGGMNVCKNIILSHSS